MYNNLFHCLIWNMCIKMINRIYFQRALKEKNISLTYSIVTLYKILYETAALFVSVRRPVRVHETSRRRGHISIKLGTQIRLVCVRTRGKYFQDLV